MADSSAPQGACPGCGQELAPDDRVCPGCGRAVENGVDPLRLVDEALRRDADGRWLVE